MLLMFRLGRPGVLPMDDYGLPNRFRLVCAKSELPSRTGARPGRREVATISNGGELVFVESGRHAEKGATLERRRLEVCPWLDSSTN